MRVLAGPRVPALAERPTVEAVAGALEAGGTTVVPGVELDHLDPSPVGADLRIKAVLDQGSGWTRYVHSRTTRGLQRPLWVTAGITRRPHVM